MTQERRPEHRRIVTNPDRGSSLAGNPPDRPQPEIRTLVIHEFAGNRIKLQKGQECVVPLPLVAFQEIGIGGKRAVGGGTSREALRKARKKQSSKPGRKPS